MALRDALILGLLWASASTARAQTQPATWAIDVQRGRHWPGEPRAVYDRDDDDEDGQPDALQTHDVPGEDLVRLRLWPERPEGTLRVSAHGSLRLLDAQGTPLPSPVEIEPGAPLPRVQGTAPSEAAGDASLALAWQGGEARLKVTVVGLWFLDGKNRPLPDGEASLALSRRVTHDGSLPRDAAAREASPDPNNFRIAVRDAAVRRQPVPRVSLESAEPSTGRVHHVLRHVRVLPTNDAQLRSPFLRLVGDRTDRSAPEVGTRLLEVRLRERVRVRYRVGRTELVQDVPVGLAGEPEDPRTALRGRLRLRALRVEPGGPPVVGHSDLDAVGLLQEQVEVANEIWLQCGVDFGPPWRADAAVVDPPPRALLAVADGDGLPGAGDGVIRLRAGLKRVGPLRVRAGAAPSETAMQIATALRGVGFVPSVTVNPKTDFGAGPSADVVVRDTRGELVELSPWPDTPLSTDAMQRVELGEVDLRDGVQQFDNMIASAGTLEERTLVKLIADDDPTTIDVLVISGFVSADRQGEAFIEGDGGSIVNTLILDRNGIRYQRQAWVQAHELGHVLLDAPYHPDNIGPDRPWLLMDADARQGRVTGPKRITAEECERVRRRSGPAASPALLRPIEP